MTAAYKTLIATLGTAPAQPDQPRPISVGSSVQPAAALLTDQATADTAFDTFAAAVIAITGDTYSTTTNQFTFGGATGLTHAQWATLGALLNTFSTAFLLTKTDTAGFSVADVKLTFDATAVVSRSELRRALRALADACEGGVGGLTP